MGSTTPTAASRHIRFYQAVADGRPPPRCPDPYRAKHDSCEGWPADDWSTWATSGVGTPAGSRHVGANRHEE
jgi:hypothetical protein